LICKRNKHLVSVTFSVTITKHPPGRIAIENEIAFRKELTESERKNTMSAETLVTGLNALLLVVFGLTSLVGTSALIKLIAAFIRGETRRPAEPTFSVEDA
jgi:hypothetical protein